MKLYEHMAKDVFRTYDITTPNGRVIDEPQGAGDVARDVGEVALKSQVLAGGRGKAGGIKFAESPSEAERVAAELLGSEIHGHPVERLLVEEKLHIDDELYLGVTLDASRQCPVILASAKGGVDIEEVPTKEIETRPVSLPWGVSPYVARQIVEALGIEGPPAGELVDVIVRLYTVFADRDAELAEINPLVISGDHVIAADARLNVDSEALFRQEDLPRTSQATEVESRVRDIGLSYVQLDGDIAVMANGAGITMATIDILKQYGGSAMNFLDAGGGASAEPMAAALGVLVETRPQAILINIFGGITRCDDVARAILTVKEEQGMPLPLVVRLVGTNEKEGVAMLQEAGIEAFRSMDDAASKVVALAEGA